MKRGEQCLCRSVHGAPWESDEVRRVDALGKVSGATRTL